jgi:hypothetical protein
MLPTITTVSHRGSGDGREEHYCSYTEKTTKGLDGRIEARYSATYTMGKAK